MISPLPYPRHPRLPPGAGSRVAPAAGAAASLLGLLGVVVGTFLPWLSSGGVQRNSYAVLGIVRRLRFVDGGPAATALSLWPLLGSVAMVPVIAGIVRWWRTAAVTTLVFGLLTGLGAAGVLVVAGGHRAAGVALSPIGPVVTVAGAVVAVLGAGLLLLAASRSGPARNPRIRDAAADAGPGRLPRITDSADPQWSPWHPPHSSPRTAPSTTAVNERERAR